MRRVGVVVMAACLLGACTHSSSKKNVGLTGQSSTTTSSAVGSTTSTTHEVSKTTAKAAPPAGLGRGDKGDKVMAMEQRLAALHYDVGKVDGTFDTETQQAVIAFQKVEGLSRTGRANDDMLSKLDVAIAPGPLVPGGGANRIEIDLKRQVLLLYQGGALTKVEMVSTGGGYRYCVDGQCDVAITPGGSFRVGVKILGKHISKLGVLYNPLFFNGGIAIHGEPAVPTYPASHGCVRIPMSASLWFYNNIPHGEAVYVVGGKSAPVPFNEPAPSDTTTTTSAPTTSTTGSTTTTVVPTPTSTTSTTL
jgi:peptidoglycan hydrolase-like protein with peptidoglycan-binding domain